MGIDMPFKVQNYLRRASAFCDCQIAAVYHMTTFTFTVRRSRSFKVTDFGTNRKPDINMLTAVLSFHVVNVVSKQ